MKKAEKLTVVVKNQANTEVTFVLPLADFGKAFDGPAIDPKVLEERQKKLQEDMEKKAAEERNKLDASKGGACGSGRQGSRRKVSVALDAAERKRPRDSRAFFLDGTSRRRRKLVAVARLHAINAVVRPNEGLVDLRMAHRVAGSVGDEVLFRDIGDIFGFGVFGEEMVERLILARPNLFRDRQPPFLGVGKHRVDVIDHAAKWIAAVSDDLTDRELC